MTDAGGDPKTLAGELDHSFRQPELLREALTHPSVSGARNYQRLEFLGDRVLGLVIAEMLYARYPNLREGALARKLADLVRRETLAEIAQAAGIDQAIVLARSAEEDGGRAKAAILADACEAVIGALYLDGGLRPARRFIERHWDALLSDRSRGGRDAKSSLQEWAQGRGLPPPVYREISRSGPDHAPSFVIEVNVQGRAPKSGEGSSKRLAEMAAAEAMLKEINDVG